jgi:nicotinate-nucleotide adenylyltransferase
MRVGLLGGTFNPVHTGHVRLAVEVLEALRLDRVELMPAGRPPHKPGTGLLPFALRADLCRAASEGVAGLAVNPLEGELDGPSYTITTLRALTAARPGDEFFFIVGMGEFLVLHEWREGLRLAEHAHLVAASRAGAEPDTGDRLAAQERAQRYAGRSWPGVKPAAPGEWTLPTGRRLVFLDVPRLDICASLVRARFLAGRRLCGLVPPAVERLLHDRAAEVREVWEQAGNSEA